MKIEERVSGGVTILDISGKITIGEATIDIKNKGNYSGSTTMMLPANQE